ncbi:hypothetical protein, partial [Chryseobacterium indoltheticum]|uniref:hypothetical protein n=1 Tax=Chryseobacterium indoltheticum TaxID=254 RepID=UPI003F4915FA
CTCMIQFWCFNPGRKKQNRSFRIYRETLSLAFSCAASSLTETKILSSNHKLLDTLFAKATRSYGFLNKYNP